tara:strand:- start:514 stop:936 length:423 start_codon:yes stop_codon:yes gene_type:complete
MKFSLFFFVVIIFFSCSNPLENKYNKVALEKDMLVLKEIITIDQLNELVEYIALSSSLGVDVTGKTYNALLNDIATSKTNETKTENSFSTKNIQELLNERLRDHMCDNFMLEMNKKGLHQHNEARNDSTEWDYENYYVGY